MSQGTTQASPFAITGAYLFTLSLMVWPFVDLLITAWPPQPGSAPWRFGFSGLLSEAHHTPLLGLFLAFCLAFVLGHRAFFRVLAGFCLLYALGLAVALVLFPLDVLEVAGMTPDNTQLPIRAGGFFSELKHLTSFLIVVFMGLGGWKTAGMKQAWEGSTGAGRVADLVVKPAGKKTPEEPEE